jgi:hypothetical protein
MPTWKHVKLMYLQLLSPSLTKSQGVRPRAMHTGHCLSTQMQRHLINTGAALLPPVEMPCSLDLATTLMESYGSEMLRSSASIRRHLKALKSDGSDISSHNNEFYVRLGPIMSEAVPMAMQDRILIYVDSESSIHPRAPACRSAHPEAMEQLGHFDGRC